MRQRAYLAATERAFHHRYLTFQQETIRHLQNPEPISISHNTIYNRLLSICLRHCKQIQSRRLFDELPQRVQNALNAIQLIHSKSLINGFAAKGKLGNAIVDLHAKCGNLDSAHKAFLQLESRDNLAWNSVLSLYSRKGMLEHVVSSFRDMRNSGVFPNQFTCAIVLSVCARLTGVLLGQVVHCVVVKMGFEFCSFCEGALIDMYAKCCCIWEARRIFDTALRPDTVSWTAMISGYIQMGLPEEAITLFKEMLKQGHVMDQVTFVTVITACMELGQIDKACCLFVQMPTPNSVAWNVMISMHAKNGYDAVAIDYFQNMMRAGVKLTRPTLGSAFCAIASLANLDYGLQVHSLAVKQGLDSNVYVGSSLINVYAKCQKMEAARKVFDLLDEKNTVLWNSMLGGYAQNKYAHDVLDLFVSMKDFGFQPDEYTYTSVLSACAYLESTEMGRQLHSLIIKNSFVSNLFVGNALVDMYAKSSSLHDAWKQFHMIKDRDNVSWNAMIVGFAQEGEEDNAFNMFRRMRSDGITPDEVPFASILSSCATIHALDKGKQLHCLLVKYGLVANLYAGSSLVDMYAKCGALEDAFEVFSWLPEKSVIAVNTLIYAYGKKDIEVPINLFKDMQRVGLIPSEVTFASLLEACNEPSKFNLGRQIHNLVVKGGFSYGDEFLAVSLLGMYFNSQKQTDARLVFSELPNPKSTVLWTAAMSGHIQNDCNEEALVLYREMRNLDNAMPDQATFVSVLKACSAMASLHDGREVHSLILRTGFITDELACSALIDMYAKCGDIRNSSQVFSEIVDTKDVITWNSMIVGFAKNGYAENALELFNEMRQSNIKPDEITFLGVLTACSHTGKVSEGRHIFNAMINDYGIQPRIDHCACMVDLLGRWGYLQEAEQFIEQLEFDPNAMIWATFLGACRIHGDERRGQRASEELIALEPGSSASYVLLSNIHAASGNWDGVNVTRREMKEKGVRKFPGCSWIKLGDSTHLFVSGDKFHPSSLEIRALLKHLKALMRDEVYVPETESFMHTED